MTGFISSACLSLPRRAVGAAALPVAALVLAGIGAGAPLAAQTFTYGKTGPNDMSNCAAGKGPAVRIAVSGLKSSTGNVFVRVYPARTGDFLKSKRYIIRVDATPRQGSMNVCVPLPAPGDYALVVQHDANGNRKTDFSTDGAGMSNNPKIKKFLGIPRPPSEEKARFTAGEGVTRMAVAIQYLS